MATTHPGMSDQTGSKPKPKKAEACQPKACPQCGSLECFERPRYYCGQLLTDKDLDAAQRYVIEKNKLHNRYLVGDGVVCGLAVRCGECCDSCVAVQPGYAIDCCGNDIVLCGPGSFDVTDYIKKCLTPTDSGCGDKITSAVCDDVPKEYCLYVSYDEQATRPMTAMVRSGGCSTTKCEASRTRETYHFDLIDKSTLDDQPDEPSIWTKLQHCFRSLLPQLKQLWQEYGALAQDISANGVITEAIHARVIKLFCKIRVIVLDLYRNGPNIRCGLVEELERIEKYLPTMADAADPAEYVKKANGALFLASAFLIEFMIDCWCDATLTPCRECHEPHGVLLACITVRNDKVVSICNIVRKQVITGPSVRYWLEPLFALVHKGLEWFCCELDLVGMIEPFLKYEAVSNPEYATAAAANVSGGYQIAKDFGQAAFTKLKPTINVAELVNPKTVKATAIYNKPVAEIRKSLGRRYELVETTMPTKAAAYDLKHLGHMSWVIPNDAKKLELMIDPETDRVTCVRVLDGSKAGDTGHDH